MSLHLDNYHVVAPKAFEMMKRDIRENDAILLQEAVSVYEKIDTSSDWNKLKNM